MADHWSRKGAFDHDHWVGFGEERVSSARRRWAGATVRVKRWTMRPGVMKGYCRGAVAPITIIVRMNIMLRRQPIIPNSLPDFGAFK
jgi:hypothetical protein